MACAAGAGRLPMVGLRGPAGLEEERIMTLSEHRGASEMTLWYSIAAAGCEGTAALTVVSAATQAD